MQVSKEAGRTREEEKAGQGRGKVGREEGVGEDGQRGGGRPAEGRV